jgi:hypothetical protein
MSNRFKADDRALKFGCRRREILKRKIPATVNGAGCGICDDANMHLICPTRQGCRRRRSAAKEPAIATVD